MKPLHTCVCFLFLFSVACGDDDASSDGSVSGDGSTTTDGSTSGDGSPAGDTSGGDGSTPFDANLVDVPGSELCPSGGCACSNGRDDDGDGLIDGMDPECTGPTDNDESSFATGIPGDNRDPIWQDCFFDGNSGAGDDGCRYRSGCLTGDLDPSDPDCQVSDRCITFCAGRTPNGCDCFGCCEVSAGGTVRTIQLAAGCSLANLDECATCVQTATECINECGTCELCPGRTLADLPPECTPDVDGGMPMYTCDDGPSCATSADCAGATEYCSLGCCLDGPI